MIVRNAQHKRLIEQAAKNLGRQFDVVDLYEATLELSNGLGNNYRNGPTLNSVRSLLSRAPWARPVNEYEYVNRSRQKCMRIVYVYDPSWAQERRAQRLAEVSA